MTANEFFDRYSSSDTNFEGGSLCIWGNWFGRPMDNFHRLKLVTLDTHLSKLILIFDNQERLTIWNAENITETQGHFQIDNADKVLWEWYYYGKPRIEENLFFEEYEHLDSKIIFKTNVNWFKANSNDLKSKKPAVSIT